MRVRGEKMLIYVAIGLCVISGIVIFALTKTSSRISRLEEKDKHHDIHT